MTTRAPAWRKKLREMAVRSVDQLIGHGTRHLEVVYHEDEERFFVWDAGQRVWTPGRERLLASPDHGLGYTLHELLAQVRGEYARDGAELLDDPGFAGVVRERARILELLFEAESRHRALAGVGRPQ